MVLLGDFMSFYQLIVGIFQLKSASFVKAPLIFFMVLRNVQQLHCLLYMKSRESEGMHEIKAAEV